MRLNIIPEQIASNNNFKSLGEWLRAIERLVIIFIPPYPFICELPTAGYGFIAW
jgi:hypothetical protein